MGELNIAAIKKAILKALEQKDLEMLECDVSLEDLLELCEIGLKYQALSDHQKRDPRVAYR